ncbi:hypothetical protein [Labilibacter marinus]|uniref:hypothetical protein n=1 Tax=Labilibacter marinus TaxID=1477105 RepID=UPI00094FB1F6|nr:hypothetical protein [Labilibacter marinus]
MPAKKNIIKRQYHSPNITEVNIDNDICLIMMTDPWQPGDGKPPGPPGQDKKKSAFEYSPENNPTSNSSFDSNPFQ